MISVQYDLRRPTPAVPTAKVISPQDLEAEREADRPGSPALPSVGLHRLRECASFPVLPSARPPIARAGGQDRLDFLKLRHMTGCA
jgi:hypothetical protein